MLRKRKGGLTTGRLSLTILRWHEMVGLILVFFLNGISCYYFLKVTYPPLISPWEGSCALLKCKYVLSYPKNELEKLTWYKDPLYSESEKKWTGTIVYTNMGDQKEVAEAFRDRAQFLGNLKEDCTLLIQNLLVNDSGNYGVRVERGDDKWITKDPYLHLNVSVSPPEPKIYVPPKIKESETTTVTCSIDHSCHERDPIELHWDGPVNGHNHTSYEENTSVPRTMNKLTFKPSWEHDKKPLRCHLSNKKDTTKTSESEIILDVKHSPKLVQVVIEGSRPIIKEGERVTLNCRVNSSNPPVVEYRWYKDNAQQAQQKKSKMEITNVSAKDAGKYSCQASNSVGYENSQSLEIDVHFAPKDAQVKKSVTGNIMEGTSVTLTCIANCNPPATGYSWYKDQHRLSKAEKDMKFQKLCAEDSGYYRCEVYCPMGNASSPPEYLNVMYAPKKVALSIHSPYPGLIKEEDSVTLVCNYNSSNPEVSTFLWYLNEIKLKSTTYDEMTIPQIAPTMAGKYSCEAINRAGSSTSPAVVVDVKYAPKNVKVQVSAPLALQEDHFAQFECNVGQSNPIVSSYKWFKDDHIYADPQESKLIFQNLKSSDSGNYTCEAMNDIDATKSQPVEVKVRYSPRNVVVSVNSSTWIIEDSNISLICHSEAEPAADRYTWYKNSRLLITNTNSQRLLLTRIKRDQSGQYQCEATNGIASKKSDVFTLDVQYNSKTIGTIAGIAAGLLIFMLLIAGILRFRVWQKLRRPKVSIGGESDDRSDTFFVVNRKQTPEDTQDELRNTSVPLDPEHQESINYAVIQFPSNHTKEERSATGACNSVTLKNSDGSAIYSFLQKPCKPPKQSRDDFQGGLRNTAVSPDPEFEESINYSAIQFPPNHTRDEAARTRPCTNNRSSVTLKSNEASAIYSVVQKPIKHLEENEPSIDYENVLDKTEEDIEYSTLVNLKCKPTNEYDWDSESDFEEIGVQYAQLRH